MNWLLLRWQLLLAFFHVFHVELGERVRLAELLSIDPEALQQQKRLKALLARHEGGAKFTNLEAVVRQLFTIFFKDFPVLLQAPSLPTPYGWQIPIFGLEVGANNTQATASDAVRSGLRHVHILLPSGPTTRATDGSTFVRKILPLKLAEVLNNLQQKHLHYLREAMVITVRTPPHLVFVLAEVRKTLATAGYAVACWFLDVRGCTPADIGEHWQAISAAKAPSEAADALQKRLQGLGGRASPMPIPAASRAFAALAVAVAVRAVRPKDLESEREEIFQQLYRRYFAHYDQGLARSMLGLLPHEIPMQFEFEVPRPLYYMNMTPELLLMRGGINSPSFAPGEAFQSDSPWWLVEIDGLGSKHHQVLQGLPEANSVVVRPKTVLNSSLPDDLVGYLDKLKVPREQHKGSFQFTVGVSAAQVPQLLRRTPPLRRRQEQTAEYCRTRHPPCSQQYEGLLLLAGMVLEQAAACPSCGFPKRCQSPWLLRTHVGDLVQTLPEEEQQSLVDDALQLWNGHPDVPLYPKGIMDYLHFPEMAEIGGMVKTRLDDASSAREEMPLEMAGLLQLASRMQLIRGFQRQAQEKGFENVKKSISACEADAARSTAMGGPGKCPVGASGCWQRRKAAI
ncbi:unnamed protein product [Durusdinium trenchii]|uniref:Uncharacterized protein n=1 Tax=Durusdinium trenchii TaxID=1381693 RepID=A0ABP0NKX8_9DINO